MEDPQVRKQFEDALSNFITRAKKDTHVLGIIIYGSMAYDEVTERSNINAFVITDEGKYRSARLVEHEVPIDIQIYNRDDFMRRVQSPRGVGLLQFLTYSKLVFSRDCSLTDFYKNLNKNVGERDCHILQMGYDLAVQYDLRKSEKYLYIKRDTAHSFHFLIHALSELGYLLCYLNDVYPPREVILRGRELKPDLFPELFDELIDTEVTHESLERTLRKTYEFLDTLDLDIYKPVLDFISENDGTATQTEINNKFAQGGWQTVELEHLARRRILRRTISPIKITKKGLVEYNEAQYHFNWKTFKSDEVIPTQVGPSNVERERVREDYKAAAEDLVKKVQADEYVLSFLLAGSLSYDTVWEKSDLDVLIVTRDDLYKDYRALVERDVYVDTYLFTRDSFRKLVQRVRDGSVFHSYFSKSTLLFTRDETILDLYEDLNNIGERDLENLLLLNYVFCKDLINKALKALDIKDDPHFALNFMTSGIRRMANIEVLLNRTIPLRESTVQALEFNPQLFHRIFTDFVHAPKKTFELVREILEKMENYLDEHLKTFIEPVIRLLEKEDEITHYDLKDHFGEIWLPVDMREFVERGLIRQTEAPFRFTKKSTSEMTQPAYQRVVRDTEKELDLEESMLLL